MNRQYALIALGGIFVGADQLFKYIARMNASARWYLWEPYLGWEHFRNTGIAFSLPLPQWVALLATPFILAILAQSIKNAKKSTTRVGLVCIFFGALSNYIDRVFFGGTIDYLRLFTSVINLADLLILGGIIFLISSKKL